MLDAILGFKKNKCKGNVDIKLYKDELPIKYSDNVLGTVTFKRQGNVVYLFATVTVEAGFRSQLVKCTDVPSKYLPDVNMKLFDTDGFDGVFVNENMMLFPVDNSNSDSSTTFNGYATYIVD